MAKKILSFLIMGLCIFGMARCSTSDHTGASSVQEGQPQDSSPESGGEQTVMCSIHITAGDTVWDGVLYDNPTAEGFAEMLPLTVELWDAALDFARAFDLPEQIAQKGMPGRQYELGSLAYWDEGPSIALIYKKSHKETIVPVVPIGKITSDVSLLEEYGGSITVKIAENVLV